MSISFPTARVPYQALVPDVSAAMRRSIQQTRASQFNGAGNIGRGRRPLQIRSAASQPKPPETISYDDRAIRTYQIWRATQIGSAKIARAQSRREIDCAIRNVTIRAPIQELLKYELAAKLQPKPAFPKRYTDELPKNIDPLRLWKTMGMYELSGLHNTMAARLRQANSISEMRELTLNMERTVKTADNPGLHAYFSLASAQADALPADEQRQARAIHTHLKTMLRETRAAVNRGEFSAAHYTRLMRRVKEIVANPSRIRL